MTRKNLNITVQDAATHFEQYCSPATVGAWADAIAGTPSGKALNYARQQVMRTFQQATWEQKLEAVCQTLHVDSSSTVPDVVWTAEEFNSTAVESLAKSVATIPNSILSSKQRKKASRALQILNLDELSDALTAEPNTVNHSIHSIKTVSPLDLLNNPNMTPAENAHETIESKTLPSNAIPIAAIVLRTPECRDIENYFSQFRPASISSDTLYLASELTHRPKWVVILEDTIKLRIQGKKSTISRIDATSTSHQIEVSFHLQDSPPTIRTARVPIRAVDRKHSSNTVTHTALVLLDLLFCHTERLETADSDSDKTLANEQLSHSGHTASAVYRLAERPRWAKHKKNSRLNTGNLTRSRKEHDVRGHIRVVDGTEYPVRPHRRRS